MKTDAATVSQSSPELNLHHVEHLSFGTSEIRVSAILVASGAWLFAAASKQTLAEHVGCGMLGSTLCFVGERDRSER